MDVTEVEVEELVGSPPGERPPIEVAAEYETAGETVRVSGRVHLIHAGTSGAVVERIRTARLASDREELAFCCSLLESSGTPVERGILLYTSLLDGSADEIDIGYDAAAVSTELSARLAEWQRARELERDRIAVAARRGEQLEFPFAETRRGQQLLVDDLDDAAGAGLTLLCAAPTGTGKTVAALYPLLRRALRENRKLFFVTAKTSQQALALETLRRMIPPASGVCAMQLAAKGRSCPLDGVQCRRLRCSYMRRFRARLDASGLLDELAARGVVDGAQITQRALAEKLCPFEVSLALAERATVIVADFNYVFDPRVYLRRFFDKPYDRHLLIIDEAHNLPARAAGYYSPELVLSQLTAGAAACRAHGGGLFLEMADLLEDFVAHSEAHLLTLEQERDGPPPYVEAPDREYVEQLELRIRDLLAEFAVYAATGGRLPTMPATRASRQSRQDPLYELLTTLGDFCHTAEYDPTLFATLWSPKIVRTLCLDPAAFLRERIEGFHSAICMSATLVPITFFGRALGADGPRSLTLELPSPFPRERRRFIAATSVDTTYRRRSESAEEIARIIDETVRLRPGNYLAFFSSFAYRDEVVAKLPKGAYEVMLQLPGIPADAALARLRANRDATLLLCGVQGGVFSEGVDYPGHMAIGVFVIGPGLPAVSMEQELIREYYDRELGAGFEYAYVLPGLSRAVQAGGRAVRSATDRAFVMLLCRRFGQKLYRDALPGYWRDEMVATGEPVAVVREFWRQQDDDEPDHDTRRSDPSQ